MKCTLVPPTTSYVLDRMRSCITFILSGATVIEDRTRNELSHWWEISIGAQGIRKYKVTYGGDVGTPIIDDEFEVTSTMGIDEIRTLQGRMADLRELPVFRAFLQSVGIPVSEPWT